MFESDYETSDLYAVARSVRVIIEGFSASAKPMEALFYSSYSQDSMRLSWISEPPLLFVRVPLSHEARCGAQVKLMPH